MPKKFTDCVAAGGKVITKQLSGGKYMHICYPKGGGSPVSGEVKTKEKSPDSKSIRKDIRKEYGR